MILQRIVFPQNRYKETADLYYKSTKAIKILNKYSAELQPDCALSLFSYFNSFSIYRWNTYTSTTSLDIHLVLSGSGIVKLIHQTQTNKNCIQEQKFSFVKDTQIAFHIETLASEGFYYLEIETTKNSSIVLKTAYFSSGTVNRHNVHIAIATCTFHRESYITTNMERICQEILENADSQLREYLNIYIIDNGQSLVADQFPNNKITLIPNVNTGGSGGFTRGLIEILHEKERFSYTHALLMDDDIELDTECLERTFSFISCLKESYMDSTIGGAMLRNDAPCILEESGANWNGKILSMGKGLNLSMTDALFQYDSLPNAEYQAWWYCCIPLSLIGLDNLPLPFFIHDDDIEYGLRNYKRLLQLNGICVWHNIFENKRPSTLEYYDVRNHLILNSIYDGRISLAEQIFIQFKRSTALILRMRYNDVLLNIRGIDDFLKGPKWWGNQDITRLHQEIMEAGYKYLTLPEDVPFDKYYMDTSASISKLTKSKCYLTINGAFLSKKKEPIIIECGSNPFVLFKRKTAYLWDPSADKAIPVQFSIKKMLHMYWQLALAFIRLIIRYPKVKKQYKNAVWLIGTERCWKQHM